MDEPRAFKLSRRALVGGGGALAAVCGAAFALRGPGRPVRGKGDNLSLYRGNYAEPDTLDPHLASALYENAIMGDLFMGLMTEDAAGNPVPGAGQIDHVSDDRLVYTFKLRPHRWSDGSAVTADDFVYSFRRILNPKTAAQYAAILYPLRNAEAVNAGHLPVEALGVRAIDASTLELAFGIEVPYITQLLAHWTTFPVPRQAIERHGDTWTRPGFLVSNGAYALKEWIPNDHILLEKNPFFWDADAVRIRHVAFYPTQDYAASLTRYRAGDLDIDIDVPSEDIAWVKQNLPGALHLAPYMLSNYVQFNVHVKPFDDVRVRTALSLAIDRETIASRVMHAGEAPAYALVPPHMPNYPGTAALRFRGQPMAERLARAQALLAQAGYGSGRPLSFDFNITNLTTVRTVAVALQSMWRAAGLDVRIVPSDEKDHYNLMLKQQFSVAWAGWVADYRDAKNFLLLGQTSAKDLNVGGYSNPVFDALIEQSDHTADAAARGQLLNKAEQIMLDDAAFIPVHYGVSRTLVSPDVRGWVDNEINVNRTRWLSLHRSAGA